MGKTKYIDVEKIPWTDLNDGRGGVNVYVTFLEKVARMPAADVVEVVRCADCKYKDKGQNECESWNMCKYRSWLYFPVNDDDYCSKGERKDG